MKSYTSVSFILIKLEKLKSEIIREFNFSENYLACKKFIQLFSSVLINLRSHLRLSSLINEIGLSNNLNILHVAKNKYLRSCYLGGGIPVNGRLAIAIHNYKFVETIFKINFIKELILKDRLIFSKKIDEFEFFIHLKLPYFYNFDGDFSLTIGTIDGDVYILTFSVGPGKMFNCNDPHIFLITGIQGINGKITEIRKITELCNNVSPAHLLVFVAEALALSTGIKTIIGVGNDHSQNNQSNNKRVRLSFDYDEFWLKILGDEIPDKFYRMSLPFIGKPIESVQAKHRSRARKRRELRNIIRNEVIPESIKNIKYNLIK